MISSLLSELATPLSPEETLVARGAPIPLQNRLLCPVCIGTGKNQPRRKRHGYVGSSCGSCKGTGQRGGHL